MKTLIALILFSISYAEAAPKTCKAILGGKLNKTAISVPEPHVFYPDPKSTGISKPGKWMGELKPVAFIPPPAVEIECGKPFLIANFDSFRASGVMPEAIVTNPWETIGYDGKPKTVPSETIYGFGDSMDYPYPPTLFEGSGGIPINLPSPDGVTDICKFHKASLPASLKAMTDIRPDPVAAQYFMTTGEGLYRWDSSKSPTGISTELELEEPYINIICDQTWSYEATFEWPFIFDQMDGMCKGEVHRKMQIKGEFNLTEDNKVVGYIDVSKPTVTYSGAVVGSYSGSSFMLPIEGILYNDPITAKSFVDLPLFNGGDGITWSYTLSCFDSEIKNSLFGAVREYFKIMMNEEEFSTTNGGYFKLNPDGDEKNFTVDMGGQGIVTIHRTWKKK